MVICSPFFTIRIRPSLTGWRRNRKPIQPAPAQLRALQTTCFFSFPNPLLLFTLYAYYLTLSNTHATANAVLSTVMQQFLDLFPVQQVIAHLFPATINNNRQKDQCALGSINETDIDAQKVKGIRDHAQKNGAAQHP